MLFIIRQSLDKNRGKSWKSLSMIALACGKEKKRKRPFFFVQYNTWKGGRSHPNPSEDCSFPMEASLLLVGFLDS